MSPSEVRQALSASFKVIKERSSDDEIVIICPMPNCGDKTGNRSVNVKTLLTNCHRCPQDQPHHLKALYRAMGLDWEEGGHSLEPEELAKLLYSTPEKKPVTPLQDVNMPEGFEELKLNHSSCYWHFCKRMAEAKHLSIEDLESAGAGFTSSGIWEPYCIFPVYEGDHLVYYQGRTYTDDGFETTKRFPSKHTVKYGANYWVHGLDELNDPQVRMAVIVESILNRLSLKRKFAELGRADVVPVCIFTHRLSLAQATKLRRQSHVSEWCFLFDSDSTDLAHQTAQTTSAIVKSTVASMPHGLNEDGTERKTNDANDDVDTAIKVIEERAKPRSIPKNRERAAHAQRTNRMSLFG